MENVNHAETRVKIFEAMFEKFGRLPKPRIKENKMKAMYFKRRYGVTRRLLEMPLWPFSVSPNARKYSTKEGRNEKIKPLKSGK